MLEAKSKKVTQWINDENFFVFLAGFIDSDGSVMIKKSGKYFRFVIRFFGEDLELLEKVRERLKEGGYNTSMHKNHSKGEIRYHKGVKFVYNEDYYILETYKKDEALGLIGEIPIRHPEKIAKKLLMEKIYGQKTIFWKDVEKEVKALKEKIKESVLLKESLRLM